MSTINWEQLSSISSRKYVCGYCNNPLASNRGYFGHDTNSPVINNTFIYICHQCNKPTFFDISGNQTPCTTYGEEINDISSEEVALLYNEARNCMGRRAYTAVVLCCRKLLMNIAVSKGAKKGLSFIEYVKYLSDQNYIPPDAEDLINFIGTLLKIIYEFPSVIKQRISGAQKP